MSMVDGMFAFAYIPASNDALWLGRDRLGIKPLYWCKEGTELWFSSEAKPLAQSLGKQLDEVGFSEWSIFQFQVSDRTFYKDIRSVKPGTVLTVSNGNIKTRTYWNLEDHLPSRRISWSPLQFVDCQWPSYRLPKAQSRKRQGSRAYAWDSRYQE